MQSTLSPKGLLLAFYNGISAPLGDAYRVFWLFDTNLEGHCRVQQFPRPP